MTFFRRYLGAALAAMGLALMPGLRNARQKTLKAPPMGRKARRGRNGGWTHRSRFAPNHIRCGTRRGSTRTRRAALRRRRHRLRG